MWVKNLGWATNVIIDTADVSAVLCIETGEKRFLLQILYNCAMLYLKHITSVFYSPAFAVL